MRIAFSVIFVLLCLLIVGPETARAGAVFEVTDELVLGDPIVAGLFPDPDLTLAQNVIREGGDSFPEAEENSRREGDSAVEKSPGRAFVFSMLAPGSGQLYVGAKRGYIYLGVEAVALTSSYFLWKSGEKKKDEYQDFADDHWFFPEQGDTCYVTPEGEVIYYTEEADSTIQYFYTYDKEHFYEDIGKYLIYISGWTSLDDRAEYLDMRDNSNGLLKGSSYALMAALVNHVVSAVDALRLARYHNLELGHGVKLNLKFKGSPHDRGVILVASRRF